MKFLRSLSERLTRLWGKSLRRQIALSFLLVALIIMLLTRVVLYSWNRDILYERSNQTSLDLARALASSSVSWTLANDVAGLQEVINGASTARDMKFALVMSPEGEVLASTVPEYVGQYFTDEISKRLLGAQAEPQILIDMRGA